MADNPRKAAVQALIQYHKEKTYSNIALDHLLKNTCMDAQDQALMSRLFYGVIERQLTIDYVLSRCSTTPIKKMHPWVADILRVGTYQLLYMDKIPPSAAVNEAVKLAKTMKQEKASGFVNGVLRGVERNKETIWKTIPQGEEGEEIRFSCPRELIAFWKTAYGETVASGLLEEINRVPDTVIRVNTLQTTVEKLGRQLKTAGINYQTFEGLEECFRSNCGSFLKNLESEANNWYYHQDAASQFACAAFGAQPGERIADVCSAPGGKSFTTAQRMNNQGYILACDIYPAKCRVIEERAAHLGISILETLVRDASDPCPAHLEEAFDRVMCDVPCSGLGVIRRKPEIRYKPLESFQDLSKLQYAILEQSARMVRPGGILQYSTCTLNPAENEEVVERFLQNHREFSPRILPLDSCFKAAGLEPDWKITLFPHIHQTDGFFIAGFNKNGVDV